MINYPQFDICFWIFLYNNLITNIDKIDIICILDKQRYV